MINFVFWWTFFGGHLVFENNVWMVNINFHTKSGGPNLVIWLSYDQFYDFAAILFLGSHLGFEKNYHAKSGPVSLKTDWVVINSVFWRPSCFQNFFCGRSIYTTKQNLELPAWKFTKLWSILCFGGHFVFLVAILFWIFICGRSTSTTMQNLEVIAWKMTELWPTPCPTLNGANESVSQWVIRRSTESFYLEM